MEEEKEGERMEKEVERMDGWTEEEKNEGGGKERLGEMLNAIQTHLCLRISSFIPFVHTTYIDFVS